MNFHLRPFIFVLRNHRFQINRQRAPIFVYGLVRTFLNDFPLTSLQIVWADVF
jgi:hypothetical protein